MKKCPKCQNIFDDDLNFCLQDGAILEIFSANNDAPTQFIPASFVTTQARKSSNSGVYLIIGLLVTVIIGLAFFIIYLMYAGNSPNKVETAEEQNTSTSAENKNPQNAKTESHPVNKNVGESTEKISEEDVRKLLSKWKQAQETKNIAGYKNCYGQPFTGIKRTTKGASTYNYNRWIKDRSQMIAKAFNLSIEIKDLQVSIDEGIATVNFEQIYRSASYSDRGPKIIKIKKFTDGKKIIYEELKYALPLK